MSYFVFPNPIPIPIRCRRVVIAAFLLLHDMVTSTALLRSCDLTRFPSNDTVAPHIRHPTATSVSNVRTDLIKTKVGTSARELVVVDLCICRALNDFSLGAGVGVKVRAVQVSDLVTLRSFQLCPSRISRSAPNICLVSTRVDRASSRPIWPYRGGCAAGRLRTALRPVQSVALRFCCGTCHVFSNNRMARGNGAR